MSPAGGSGRPAGAVRVRGPLLHLPPAEKRLVAVHGGVLGASRGGALPGRRGLPAFFWEGGRRVFPVFFLSSKCFSVFFRRKFEGRRFFFPFSFGGSSRNFFFTFFRVKSGRCFLSRFLSFSLSLKRSLCIFLSSFFSLFFEGGGEKLVCFSFFHFQEKFSQISFPSTFEIGRVQSLFFPKPRRCLAK